MNFIVIRMLQQCVQMLDNGAAWWHHRPLYSLLVGLISGVLAGTSLALSPALIALILAATAAVWWPWPHRHLQTCCRLLLAGFTLAHVSVSYQQRAHPLNHIAHQLHRFARQRIQIEGKIDRPVDVRYGRQYVFVRLQRIMHDPHGWQSAAGRVRLKIQDPDLVLWPGDRIRVERLRLHPVRNFQNPGRFDFRGLMHRQGIYAVGGISRPGRVHLLERPAQWRWDRACAQWRQHMLNHIRANLPPPADAVLAAVVLGHRGMLTPGHEHAFRAAGLAHLLVVSGLHVGFVAFASFISLRTLCRYLRSWAPRSWLPALRPTPVAALLTMIPLLFYCSLVGWKISTLRAAMMAGSYLLALAVSRQREPLQAVSLAAVLILVFNPTALFSLGFQLSFAAVAMILLASQRLTPDGISGWRRALYGSGLATSAAFMGTLPILASSFHTIPIYSPLTNLILLPLVSLIVPGGVIILLLTSLWPASASLLFAPLTPLLTGLVTGAQYIAARPEALYHTASPPAAAILGYYGLLLSVLLMPHQRSRYIACSLCGLLMLSSMGWAYIITSRPSQLRVTFLDVGTGDAIWIQTPEGHNILIDGGGTYNGQFDIGARVVAPVLWQHHIGRFDLMALTHMHPNHARGLASLFRLFGSQHLLTNGSPIYAGYLQDMSALATLRGTSMHNAKNGPRHWQWGHLQLSILSPPSHASPHIWQPPTENDRSIVLRLQFGKIRMLFTGDIQRATEQWLATHIPDLRADILHIPHHGSRTSTHPDFIERVQPAAGIITAGAGNPYGHPHPRVLKTLAQYNVRVFRTDRHGAITITTDGTQYHIKPFIADALSPPKAVHIAPP